MNAPVREPADGPSKDGLLDYAPKKIRDAESDPIPGAPVKGDAAAPHRFLPAREELDPIPHAGSSSAHNLLARLSMAHQRALEPAHS